MHEQPAAVLSGAPVLPLEEELGNIAITERDFQARMRRILEVLERRKGEVTISLILNMQRQAIKQLCTWWVLGLSLFASGRERSATGAPFTSVQIRSLVRERQCEKCEHKWAGTDRERCPECGSNKIITGAIKPYIYNCGPRQDRALGAKDVRAAETRGESIYVLKRANLNGEGVFEVSIDDAFTILRQHGLGVRTQEWFFRSGQKTGPGDEKKRTWPVRDMCIVVETAHEAMLQATRETQLVES